MSVDPIAARRFIESLSMQMEDHLAAWKSSIVDAKRDIENTLNSVSERIPAQARPLFPEDLIAVMLEDAMPALAAPPAPVQIEVEKIVERVVERFVPGPASPPDWSLARGSLAAIESARTQVDVLTRFLGQANAHASRVALLVLRNDRLTGWKAIGFDASGGRDEAIKAIDIGIHDDPFAAEALKRERSLLAEPPDEGSPLRRALGGRTPARTLLVPMVIRDRLAGLLCADELPGEEGRLNESALEILTFVTGLTVDLLAARKKIPSPTLTPMGEEIAKFKAAPSVEAGGAAATVRATPVPQPEAFDLDTPAAPPPSRASSTPSVSVRATEPSRSAPAPSFDSTDSSSRRKITDAGEALRALEESASARKKPESFELNEPGAAPPVAAPEPRPSPAPVKHSIEDLGLTTAIPSPGFSRSAPPPPVPRPAPVAPPGDLTMAFDQLKAASSPAPVAVPPPAPAKPVAAVPEAAPAAEAVAPGAGAPMAPPAGFVPRGKAGRGDDQQRAVEDAKRLARLLVSEIKLYNERKVEEGRGKGDLYDRLKDDIERSRQVYEERTPEAVRAGTNFFREELVRILGEGRADSLGPMG